MSLFGNPRQADLESFFQSSVESASDFKPKRDFGFYILEIFFLFNLSYLGFMAVGIMLGARDVSALGRLFLNPAETITTFSKMTLMLSLALIGAYNARIRREAATVLAIGHVIAVTAQLWLYLGYRPNPLYPDDTPYLLAGIIGDGIVALLFVYLAVKPRPASDNQPAAQVVDLQSPVSTFYRLWLLAAGILYAGFAAAIVLIRGLAEPESGLGAVFGSPDPLVSNSIVRCGTIALLCFFLSCNPRIRKYLTAPLVYALGVSIAGCFVMALLGQTAIVTRSGGKAEGAWFLILQIAIDGTVLFLTLGVRKLQYQVDYRVTSLSPTSAECILA